MFVQRNNSMFDARISGINGRVAEGLGKNPPGICQVREVQYRRASNVRRHGRAKRKARRKKSVYRKESIRSRCDAEKKTGRRMPAREKGKMVD